MKMAYFDCIAGISGDMILGALVDAGLSIDMLREELSGLNIRGFEIKTRQVKKHQLNATKVEVLSTEKHPHRNLADIISIINASSLSENIKNTSCHIFERLAQVEAEIHGTTPEEVHFHEVGAVDAIVDVVGALVGWEKLGVKQFYSSPIKLGSGTVKCAHGIIPIPAPATVKLLQGYPVIKTDIPAELTTPTGAAILTTLVGSYQKMPEMNIQNIGYGAGSRDLDEIPNLLRILIGESQPSYQMDQVVIVETNIDDMNPEYYPYVMEKILTSGAMDVYLTPIIMKKGRPGMVLSALTDLKQLEEIVAIIYRETTSLGVRIMPVERRKLPRSSEKLDTPLGKVMVKIVYYDGERKVIPEYEECKRLAREKNLPLDKVYDIIRQAGK